MTHILIGLHAGLGELGILAFVWVFIELLNPTETRLKRAKIAAIIGSLSFFLSWISGGYYYVEFYGSIVKPLIKDGPTPWAHSVITETKEHVFLFLPFLSLFVTGLLCKYSDNVHKIKKYRVHILLLSGLIFVLGASMAGMGYLISSGMRDALESLNGLTY